MHETATARKTRSGSQHSPAASRCSWYGTQTRRQFSSKFEKWEETMENLQGKWALITGASSGFGEEFARQYAAQGRPLVLVARRLEKLETLATELRETYRVDVIVEQVDLSSVAAVIQLHQRLRERGIAIDILINNAGHGLQGTFVDGTSAGYFLQLAVSGTPTFT